MDEGGENRSRRPGAPRSPRCSPEARTGREEDRWMEAGKGVFPKYCFSFELTLSPLFLRTAWKRAKPYLKPLSLTPGF